MLLRAWLPRLRAGSAQLSLDTGTRQKPRCLPSGGRVPKREAGTAYHPGLWEQDWYRAMVCGLGTALQGQREDGSRLLTLSPKSQEPGSWHYFTVLWQGKEGGKGQRIYIWGYRESNGESLMHGCVFADQAVKIKQRLTTRIKPTHTKIHICPRVCFCFPVFMGAFTKLIKN